jgi:hypothetical protein
MTVSLENVFKQRLQDSGLLPYLFTERSQFLDFPDSFFVELVVKDGTKLPEFSRVVDQIRAEAPEQHLNAIVRATWDVENVGDPIQAYSKETGTPRFAVQYPVDLKSGNATTRVWVEVTTLADRTLESHGADRDDLRTIVREFVRAQLKKGGASYWDPQKFPHLEINSDTASFILSGALPGWNKKRSVT